MVLICYSLEKTWDFAIFCKDNFIFLTMKATISFSEFRESPKKMPLAPAQSANSKRIMSTAHNKWAQGDGPGMVPDGPGCKF